jgi:GT2 family glycosyltransferase
LLGRNVLLLDRDGDLLKPLVEQWAEKVTLFAAGNGVASVSLQADDRYDVIVALSDDVRAYPSAWMTSVLDTQLKHGGMLLCRADAAGGDRRDDPAIPSYLEDRFRYRRTFFQAIVRVSAILPERGRSMPGNAAAYLSLHPRSASDGPTAVTPLLPHLADPSAVILMLSDAKIAQGLDEASVLPMRAGDRDGQPVIFAGDGARTRRPSSESEEDLAAIAGQLSALLKRHVPVSVEAIRASLSAVFDDQGQTQVKLEKAERQLAKRQAQLASLQSGHAAAAERHEAQARQIVDQRGRLEYLAGQADALTRQLEAARADLGRARQAESEALIKARLEADRLAALLRQQESALLSLREETGETVARLTAEVRRFEGVSLHQADELRDALAKIETTRRENEAWRRKKTAEHQAALQERDALAVLLKQQEGKMEQARASYEARIADMATRIGKAEHAGRRRVEDLDNLTRRLTAAHDAIAKERDAKSDAAARLAMSEERVNGSIRALKSVRRKASRAEAQITAQRELRQAGDVVRTALRNRSAPPLVATSLSAVQLAAISRLGLFDRDWYARTYGTMPGNAWMHFVARGAARGNDPHPMFHGRWFAERYPDLTRRTGSLAAYLSSKDRRTLSPHPLFDPAYYVATYPGVARSRLEPLTHYLRRGVDSGRSPHPLIDVAWIERTWPQDVNRFSLPAYLTDADLFRRDPHPLFSGSYYLAENPDVADSGVNPLVHYLVDGWRQGRSPHPDFHNDWYLAANPDVLASGQNPLLHYVTHGGFEDRAVTPLFDQRFYLARYPDVASGGVAPLVHFAAYGKAERRSFNQTGSADSSIRSMQGPTDNLAPAILSAIDDCLEELAVKVDRPARLALSLREADWPPKPINDYWLPQALRDHIIESHGEGAIGLYWYLFSVLETYADDADGFANSPELATLTSRARKLSEHRAQRDAGRSIDASIIIPVYNNILDTLLAIVSVLELDSRAVFEIIVADDQSKDRTAEVIGQIGGVVRHHLQPRNLGFLLNCNEAAKTASGEIVILLNNDTIALPGWLDALVDGFEADSRAGLVGSKLLNGDGTLQEAGGIIWSDGSGWNFGRNQNPRAPEFNYVKDADYISGAAIAIRADLWRELGGFDPAFAPAYYEDTDIAFRIRAKGYRTLYQPFSEIVHHEGRSHGKDVTSGIKAYQARNQAVMMERWADELARNHYPNAVNVAAARDRSGGRPHVLIVDHYVPQWDRDAGSRSIYHYICMFVQRGFQVTFWPDNLHRDPDYTAPLQRMGVEVIYGSAYVGRFAEWLNADGRQFDYILLSRPHITPPYLDASVAHGGKLLFYGHDLHYLRMAAQQQVNPDEVSDDAIAKMKAQELAICRRVDLFLYPSQFEIDEICGEIGRRDHGMALPLNVFGDGEIADAPAALAARRQERSILFVGGFAHPPNGDAAIWFASEVMPKLLAHDSGFVFKLVGSNATEAILALAGPNVEILGRVGDEELDDLYRQCGMAIAPLRYGGGMKGKVVEALSKGIPLVTTSVGAQGLNQPEDYCWIGDSAEALVAQIVNCVAQPDRRAERVAAGIDYVRAHFSVDAVASKLAPYIPEVKKDFENSDYA